MFFTRRLHQEMAACTLKTCQINIATDLAAITVWQEKVQEANNREGHFDVKFLQARYAKGVARVEKIMQDKHRYCESEGLAGVQPETLRFMEPSDNGNGILSWFLSPFHFEEIIFFQVNPRIVLPHRSTSEDLPLHHGCHYLAWTCLAFFRMVLKSLNWHWMNCCLEVSNW